MMKYIITFAIFVQMAYGQDINDYSPETVSEWSSGKYFNDLNEICIEDCNKTCVQKCPVPDLCNDDEIQCGKEDLPLGVWPDCIRDDICVPDGCECKYNLNVLISFLAAQTFIITLILMFYSFFLHKYRLNRSNTRK